MHRKIWFREIQTLTLVMFAVHIILLCAGCGDQSVPNGAIPQAQAQLPDGESEKSSPGKQPKESEKPFPGKQPTESDEGNQVPTNRLALETSPYLLLHAHNPVNWYPWGTEAFEKAKAENKVIFLSVGYSSCHWCHVMERESFVDEEIAAYLNEHFVCIKVDREERPDVDSIYMTAVQAISGNGGWPMSVFLTPEAKPFYGGTYFPARDGDRGGAMGFLTLLNRVNDVWNEQREELLENADEIARRIHLHLDGRQPASLQPLDQEFLKQVQASLAGQFDVEYGGFGFMPTNPQVPKFPMPGNLMFLIDRFAKLTDETEESQAARSMVITSLERMAMGGIRDHLGGGFHRYSVDRFWKIPHFEKMLYDNAQLASVYSEAFVVTKRLDFRKIVQEMLAFILREMTTEEGAFYSALDAESENEEGKFYRWELAEVEALLSKEEFALFAAIYGFDREPNFEGEYYAPQFVESLEHQITARNTTFTDLEAQLEPIRQKLLVERNRRPRPLTDTKVLTSWNGLMIRGFADAGRCLEDASYIEVAERAATFALEKLRTSAGRLLRTYSNGTAKLNAYLNDYAYLTDGLIALHRATDDQRWLEAAEQLTVKQIELFWDEQQGGFFFTSDDHESLLARIKNPTDGSQPSGNSVSADNLIYLAVALNKSEYLDKAEQIIVSVSGKISQSPGSATRMALALSKLLEVKHGDADEPTP